MMAGTCQQPNVGAGPLHAFALTLRPAQRKTLREERWVAGTPVRPATNAGWWSVLHHELQTAAHRSFIHHQQVQAITQAGH
ncbi:MAG TPA: hypothetical protein PLL18_11215, partial [Flavobacteriales bacterium]|nr:hypothetical protein [Flavobacteriales bacterium]